MMKRLLVSFLLLIVLAGCQEKKDPPARVLPTDDLEGSVHDFMEEYGNLIREGNFDSVPFLYDTLGAIIIGGDKKEFHPMDSLKAKYGRYSKSKVYFKWDSMDVQMLDTSIALVASIFYWNQKPAKDTLKFYYTGVLIKQRERWKIKHEHESPDYASFKKF